MATKAALVLTGIAIALLLTYAADLAASQGTDSGFLPFDAMTRGIALGGASIVLPLIAYGLAWKSPSPAAGALIIIAGALIMAGGVASIDTSEPAEAEEGERSGMGPVPLLVIGAVIVGMGVHTIMRARR